MKKNDIFETGIRDLSDEGSGIGTYDGMTFFIPGALPGDRIKAGVTKLKKSYGYARLVSVIEPSSDRVEARCPVAGRCGGCQVMGLSYDAQLRLKERRVKDALVRIGGFDAGFIDSVSEPIIGMDEPYRYRNKAQYPVRTDKNGDIRIGFYAPHSHRVIECEDCLIGQEKDKDIIEAVRAYMIANHISAYDEETGKGLIRHILIRYGRGSARKDDTKAVKKDSGQQVMVCLIINGTSLPHSDKLVSALSEIEHIVSIVINENTRRDNVILGKRTTCLWGKDHIIDHIRDIDFKIQARSFYQVNPEQMERLYVKAAEYADPKGDEVVWDIYCGIGTIGLTLAHKVQKIHGVELVPEAIEDAKANAKTNGIDNAVFTVGAAEDVLPDAVPDIVIVDPPRKGCDERCLDAIVHTDVAKIVYVSCNPATLARDLRYLNDRGYALKAVTPVDQFCHSMHVETVVLLGKNAAKSKSYVKLGLDVDDYHRIKDSEKGSE